MKAILRSLRYPAAPERPALTLNGTTSLFLDALRLFAATVVLLHHALGEWQDHGSGNAADHLLARGSLLSTEIHKGGSWAVIVFFVLSGYVIAHVTARNGRLQDYLAARLSRLYSILVPALLLAGGVELALRAVDSDLLSDFTRGTSWPRYIVTLLLSNEIWLFSAAPPINGPLWSLSFELWYYVIFGLWHFRREVRGGTWLALAACLVAGPKILLLMPCWLAGVAAYRFSQRRNRPVAGSLSVVVVLIACSFVMLKFVSNWPSTPGAPFFYAHQFVTDWIVASLVATALLWLPLTGRIRPLRGDGEIRLHSAMRKLGDLTYPLYAFHMPILVFMVAAMPAMFGVAAPGLLTLATVAFIASLLLGVVMERTRNHWRRLFLSATGFFFSFLLRGNGMKAIEADPQ